MFQIDEQQVIRCKIGVKGDTCDERMCIVIHVYRCGTSLQSAAATNGVTIVASAVIASAAVATLLMASADKADARSAGRTHRSAMCARSRARYSVGVYTLSHCQTQVRGEGCAVNAISFTETDRCGEPIQRCQCLSGYEGDGHVECVGMKTRQFSKTMLPYRRRRVRRRQYMPRRCRLHQHTGQLLLSVQRWLRWRWHQRVLGLLLCIATSKNAYEQATFLYRYDTHQTLPENVPKAGWQLHRPLIIFGERRDKLLVRVCVLFAPPTLNLL